MISSIVREFSNHGTQKNNKVPKFHFAPRKRMLFLFARLLP